MRQNLAIGVAPGDPSGIGYEITAKALADLRREGVLDGCRVVVYAHEGLFRKASARFAPGLELASAGTAVREALPESISVRDAGISIDGFRPGVLDADCARCAHQALMKCAADAKSGAIDGICTGPIHKGAMRLAGISEIGHTEMLASAFGAEDPMTLFITRALRIFFYTRHLSLRQAIDALDVDRLVAFGVRMDAQTRQLGIKSPKFAMAALNPHAGDGGQFGTEEAEILIPAARALRLRGIDITDPIGADSVFAQAAQGRYDAVLSLYHDQGHIAAKTYDFERTISATLGLPCLRTSVDHGTAMDIAWQGIAQCVSMKTAICELLKYL
ncbi:MAG: 4-hydroxythreonine-4-phosphate dehydrogenase PdxA [Proteobacteria bacterium]|nr:4-hydroxythreonine-4-phosphate dehydrogenase PdxA [Pseudomonadota bacterium]